MAKTNNQKYIERFFDEKDIPEKTFEVEHEGMTHLVENEFIIDMIRNHVHESELVGIIRILRKIDFANGDVNHFLEHLAKGYVVTNY